MKALACLALLVALTGCGSSVAASPPPPSPTPSATEPEWKIDPSFNSTDLAYIELMIPMDDQLLRVLDLGQKQASAPALREFAGKVAAGHRAEVAQLIAIRTRSGLPIRNPHEGHDMPGMMTEPEIDALGKLSGPAFDQDFTKNLKEHLDQTTLLARSIANAGKDPETKKLGKTLIAGRTTQLKQLAAVS
ncbi:DUF305 domain-containing protein [Kribbella italica]|uniref:Uncharacterized protein (DUF305 family) n=1 Tax=Kribbella italica TaxID=1540520 RepID=A0A7W9J195_9ACTN|nr:DUF305 domain-containing protein [Kribbella italica]MBB5833779.1 uncharacterized protein (DUF305 family) [Kribbella italica]